MIKSGVEFTELKSPGALEPSPLPRFQMNLAKWNTVVVMDGITLNGVRDIKVHQDVEGYPVVTIEFLAVQVTGLDQKP